MLPIVGTVGEPYRFVIKVEIDAKGVIVGCHTIEPPNFRDGTGFCRYFMAAPPIAPYRDAAGNAVSKVLTITHELQIADR